MPANLFHDLASRAHFTAEKMNKINLYESGRLFCDIYCLLPGQSQKLHAHAENDKIYYAVSGTTSVTIGDEKRKLLPGELAVAPAGVPHGLFNDSDGPAIVLAIMAPHPDFKNKSED